ncbi:hypothetical protein [Aureispira anguillae]|uniref:Uncharacterized protein n=1 Tax=Aureispira anguillae TaxID=2864201 RepID=A0A915YD16_9BACT|nr:hypothetical protein [Aureispira anguillae]BDS10844.1 hypothetical protein AsAng_0015540 [Aureispira anguillae]
MYYKKQINTLEEAEQLALFLKMSIRQLLRKKRMYDGLLAKRIRRKTGWAAVWPVGLNRIKLLNDPRCKSILLNLFCLKEAIRIKRFIQKLNKIRSAFTN